MLLGEIKQGDKKTQYFLANKMIYIDCLVKGVYECDPQAWICLGEEKPIFLKEGDHRIKLYHHLMRIISIKNKKWELHVRKNPQDELPF